MERAVVAITRAVFPQTLQLLHSQFVVRDNQSDTPLGEEALIAHLKGADAALTTASDKVDAAVLRACPTLKIVANMAVGFNNLDIAALSAAGVQATNTPDVLTETTADFGFALLLATARRMGEAERFLRANQWKKWALDLFAGSDVHGSTLGILGMGRIGQSIARRAAHGFGMEVIYHNRTQLEAAAQHGCHARYVSTEDLWRQSDHLILTLPYSRENHHIVGEAQLRQMKPTATLINIARGGIVDEKALVYALREGVIAAAGLDVFEDEPRVHPDLLTLPNVVLTPHIASATVATRLAMANLAAHNLMDFFAGRAVRSPINHIASPHQT